MHCESDKLDELTTWKRIKLGTGLESAADFQRAIEEAGCKISYWGRNPINSSHFNVSSQETEVELVMVSNEDLGFESGAKEVETYARAKELGLVLCPSEVGPQLRLQYKDQPAGTILHIAMEPIIVGDHPEVFTVSHSRHVGLTLNGDHGYCGGYRGRIAKWVFLRNIPCR